MAHYLFFQGDQRGWADKNSATSPRWEKGPAMLPALLLLLVAMSAVAKLDPFRLSAGLFSPDGIFPSPLEAQFEKIASTTGVSVQTYLKRNWDFYRFEYFCTAHCR